MSHQPPVTSLSSIPPIPLSAVTGVQCRSCHRLPGWGTPEESDRKLLKANRLDSALDGRRQHKRRHKCVFGASEIC